MVGGAGSAAPRGATGLTAPMRSRPLVKVLLSPPTLAPGGRLLAEGVLTSRSETPVDWVKMRLVNRVFTAIGAGNARSTSEATPYRREWTSSPMKLARGEHRFRVAFDLPADAAPTYTGEDAAIQWLLTVHVSIPWWPDRVETFGVPVALPGGGTLESRPIAVATSREGPRGTVPFMEIALDSTHVALGDVLAGSISISNLRGKRVRGVDLSFVETETLSAPAFHTRVARTFLVRVHDGAPRENEAIPFRVRLPDRATPTFRSGPIQVSTHVEVRADVAWTEDVVVRTPIHVAPRGTQKARGWIAPVGRERRALVWQLVATNAGLVSDPEAERMTGVRGPVAVEVRTEQRDADFWLVAQLGWPTLGLDLDVTERRWTDLLSGDVVKMGLEKIDGRFCARAREHAQAAPLLQHVLGWLTPFEEVKVDDRGATLAMRGAAHTAERLEPFVQAVVRAAEAFASASDGVPPPASFAATVPAWRAAAERLRGRFEPGRMWIHDGQMGTDRVELGTTWGRKGAHLGTRLRVAIDPPLAAPPPSPDDPAISPAARDAWRALAASARAVRVEADAVTVDLAAKLDDPQTVMPLLESAVGLRRALGGVLAQGPFR